MALWPAQGRERRVEFRAKTQQGRDTVKLHNVAAHGERGQELGTLQWLRLVRQCRKPAVHAALPILWVQRQGIDREAVQIAQSESEQAARPQCRRKRGQQPKPEHRCGAAC